MRRLSANMVHCRENSFLICKSFDQHQELTAPLINRLGLGRGGIIRIHWGTACLGAGAGGWMAYKKPARILQKQVENTGLLAKISIARGYSWLGRSRKMPVALRRL